MNYINDYMPKSDFEIKINGNVIIKCKKSVLIKYFNYFENLYNVCDLTKWINNIDNKYCNLFSSSNESELFLFSNSGNRMIKELFEIVCTKDEINDYQILKLLNVESEYILNDEDIDKVFAKKINLLVDILDYFEATDLVKNAFYDALCKYIDKINKIKKYINFNNDFIIGYVIYTAKIFEKAYTLTDDYGGYEGSYRGQRRYYVGPSTSIPDNSMKQNIYDLLTIIIYWKDELLKYYNIKIFIDKIKEVIISLQATGYLFDKNYEKLYLENKNILPFECMKFKN